MKKSDIHLDDIYRILFGNAPAQFLLEVFLRTLITYIALLIVLKVLGKRMDGKITILEMAVIVTVGAIVAAAFHLPDKGILEAVTALGAVFVLDKLFATLFFRAPKFEAMAQGSTSILVKDGVMQLPAMEANGITKENVFATLRGRRITNLGKVKRLYLEACGLLSMFEEREDNPGLSVLPMEVQRSWDDKAGKFIACDQCGFTKPAAERASPCPNCGAEHWVTAQHESRPT